MKNSPFFNESFARTIPCAIPFESACSFITFKKDNSIEAFLKSLIVCDWIKQRMRHCDLLLDNVLEQMRQVFGSCSASCIASLKAVLKFLTDVRIYAIHYEHLQAMCLLLNTGMVVNFQ